MPGRVLVDRVRVQLFSLSSTLPPPPHPPSLILKMPERKPRGAFIVIEGLDRSGKSTQVALLEQRFKAEGRPVRLVKFPGEQCSRPCTRSGSLMKITHARPHNTHWQDDRRVSPLPVRDGRPRHPSPLLRQPLGARVSPPSLSPQLPLTMIACPPDHPSSTHSTRAPP